MDRVKCPRCGAPEVWVRPDGTMNDHSRYVDGGGAGPYQDHTMMRCEGTGQRPDQVATG